MAGMAARCGEIVRTGPDGEQSADELAARSVAFLAGGGEMGVRMRAHDWKMTSLGPAEAWPQCLRTAASIMLNSRHPMFLAWGPELAFLYNDGYIPILGAKHPRTLGLPFARVWSDILADLEPLIERALGGEPTWSEDMHLVTERNGYPEDTWYTFSYSPVRDESGGVGGMFCACTETTARVQTENRMRFLLEVEKKLRDLQNPATILAFAAESLGRHLRADRVGFFEVVGDETLSFGEYWTNGVLAPLCDSGAATVIGPGYLSSFKAGQTLAVADTEQDPLAAGSILASIGVRSGLGAPIIRSGRLHGGLYVNHGSPRHWSGDEVSLVRGVADQAWEAAERARAQAALHESESGLQLLIDAMPVLISYIDSEHRYRFNNRTYELWFGSTREALRGRHMREVLGDAAYERVLPSVEQALAGNPVHLEAELDYKGAGRRQVDVRYLPHRIEGNVDGFIVVVEDITDRKRSERALREADRRKDEFLAMLAHELRNPLAPIRTAAQVLKLAKSSESHVLQTGEIIVRQVDHMTRIVDDLLDVSRVTQGLVRLARAPVDLREVIAAATEQCRPLIEGGRHRLTLTLPPEPLRVSGDQVRLVQVLGNLLGNAAKYSDPGTEIVIAVEARPDDAVLTVRDNGIGISPGLLPHVFDPFTQGDRAAARSQGGLGLGLALVRRLVEMHGGSVGAYSEGPGHGAQFVVRLPRLQESAARADARPSEAASPQNRDASLSIMVVDDNQDAADVLEVLLELEGHRVEVAYEAHGALERVRQEMPRVALLDIGLPGIDGYELAREIRKLAGNTPVTLIALTGYGQDDDRRRSREAGFDHHLVKPVDPRTVSALLASLAHRDTGVLS